VLVLAQGGLAAAKADPALASGVNVARGLITNEGVAESLGEKAVDITGIPE
jgi:alanine dehydrogenase